MQHIARKRFGQHFLHDRNIIAEIIDAIEIQTTDFVVEIGPGLGALTEPLLKKLLHLHVIELDRDLAALLRERHTPARLTVHEQDALKFDLATLGNNIRLVGNLPYNISTPLLFHFAQFLAQLRDGHFMLQLEVVERMVAAPSSPSYGRLSVMLQLDFDMELLLHIPPEAFTPPPKVESAIVRMLPIRDKRHGLVDRVLFEKVVARAFTQRRKTLRNSLSAFLAPEDFRKLEIDSILRAENLSVQDYIKITNCLALRGNASAALGA